MTTNKKVTARLIIEMMGSPKEHLEAALKTYMERLKQESNLNIKNEEYAEAKEKDGLFTTFIEFEATFPDTGHLLAFCFDAMPSSVEVLEPLELTLPAQDFTNFINDLQSRLHQVDMALKQLTATSKVLDKNAVNVMRNFAKYALMASPKTAEELGKIMGAANKDITPFLTLMVEDDILEKEGNTYRVAARHDKK